jgi:hypothetical protein
VLTAEGLLAPERGGVVICGALSRGFLALVGRSIASCRCSGVSFVFRPRFTPRRLARSLLRHCPNFLREAEGLAVSADGIAIAVMKAKGMLLGDDPLRQKPLNSTLYALRRPSKRGSLERIGL